MSAAFGVIAALFTWRSASHWTGVIAAATYFIAGLVISEVLYGWATQAELQPNIDGLSFDEVLLFGLVPGLFAVMLSAWLTRESGEGASTS
jgi:hypothetical protein